jgi:hypothetical protein
VGLGFGGGGDGLGLYNVGLGRWGSGCVGGPVGIYVRGPTRVFGGGPASREPSSLRVYFFLKKY